MENRPSFATKRGPFYFPTKQVNKYIDVNTGWTENLSKYKVKQERGFNILKINRDRQRKEGDRNPQATSIDNTPSSDSTAATLSTNVPATLTSSNPAESNGSTSGSSKDG